MKNKTINRCLYCYKELDEHQIDFHPKCSKIFFGKETPPSLSLNKDELQKMAKDIVNRSIAIPGVQPKLSLNLEPNPNDPKKSRLTIIGAWGEYILKPQSESYSCLAENEDLTMHLAQLAKITTAQHSLIRTETGQLAYITKRFDRIKKQKVPMEDFCQLLEVPSSGRSKYDNGSMEKIAKAIKKYSSVPGIDLITFFDISVFSFLIGNSDMHLKNFSMIKNKENQYRLSPAYDLISSNVAQPEDKEQMALHLNGKKNKITRKDFMEFSKKLDISQTIVEKIFVKYDELMETFKEFILISFLSEEVKEEYLQLMKNRKKALE